VKQLGGFIEAMGTSRIWAISKMSLVSVPSHQSHLPHELAWEKGYKAQGKEIPIKIFLLEVKKKTNCLPPAASPFLVFYTSSKLIKG